VSRAITITDLRAAFAAHLETLERYNLAPSDGRLVLTEGSKTYGIAYRINWTGYQVPDELHGTRATSGHAEPPIGESYLGMTKAEAHETLVARTRVIGDVMHCLKQAGRLVGEQ
jgi:hypothetical protein